MKNQLIRTQNLVDSFFNDDFFNRYTYGNDIDIYQEDDKYIVEADLPGFSKDDIKIEFKNDVLTIDAELNETVEDTSNKNYYYRSRSTRSFNKSIRFSKIDGDQIMASYDNGVLKVALPLLDDSVSNVKRIAVE